MSPLLDVEEAIEAGYSLLIELSQDCADNLVLVTEELMALRH